jgi:ubiquitin-conjugating enzyme E2 Z
MSETKSPKTIVVKKETMQRLLHDIKHILRNPLIDSGIYYEHDETNMFRGYALICGPSDTPYFSGFYLFQFDFPYNYPFSPPIVTFCTNDGFTRFNPNLYKNGKVCVSILNTWAGEEWSACQTISSILLVLCSLLNNEPLLNEPGCTKSDAFFIPYIKMLEYRNIEFAICEILMSPTKIKPEFHIFLDTMRKIFFQNYDKLMEFVENKIKINPELNIQMQNMYGMSIYTNYTKLKNKLISCKDHLQQKI